MSRPLASAARLATRVMGVAAAATLVYWMLLPVISLGGPAVGVDAVVVASDSMAPGMLAGDVVVVGRADSGRLAPGEVVVFDSGGRSIIHRIVAVNPDGSLVTQGDANPFPDVEPVDPGSVSGIARGAIPYLGLPRVWAESGRWGPLIVWGLLMMGAVWTARWSLRPVSVRIGG